MQKNSYNHVFKFCREVEQTVRNIFRRASLPDRDAQLDCFGIRERFFFFFFFYMCLMHLPNK